MTERAELEQAVCSYAERAAVKLRKQSLACASIQVFVMTNRFKPSETQYSASRTVSLPVASADSAKLAKAQRLKEIIERRYTAPAGNL
jgi:DNA polymerase V